MWNDLCVGYLRLSIEDGDIVADSDKKESNSITNQRNLIKNYLQNTRDVDSNYIELVDDGYSGTNFNRPQIQKLFEWIKQGRVKSIIVKDISRFGRDYIEVGDYIEQIFPFMNIRFISINDNYDSNEYKGMTSGMEIAFRNLMYGLYSKDLSIKMLSSREMRIKNGYFTGGLPPFGYEFATSNKRKLKIDPIASNYVKRIFELALIESSTGGIARVLNKEDIPTPAVYKNSVKQTYSIGGTIQYWDAKKVRKIIQNEVYLGIVVNKKYQVVDVGAKRYKRVPNEERVYSHNQHESLVTQEDFKTAQKILLGNGKQKYIKHYRDEENILGGFLYCVECKKALIFSKSKDSGFYICKRPSMDSTAKCSKDKLYKDKIESIIIECLNKRLEVLGSGVRTESKTIFTLLQEEKELEKELGKIKNQKQRLYEVYRNQGLSKESFKSQNEFLQYQRRKNEQELMRIKEEIIKHTQTGVAKISKDQISKLTKEILKDHIKKIWVYDGEKIEIQWQ